MAISISNSRKAAIMDYLLGGIAPVALTTVYVALLTDLNTDVQRANGVFTEVTTANWTDYGRVAVPNNTTNWPISTTNVSMSTVTKQNGTVITFTTSAVVMGIGPTPTGFIIFDSLTGSGAANVIASGPILSGNGMVVMGNAVSFDIATLVCSIT